jgi:hypothetical protein
VRLFARDHVLVGVVEVVVAHDAGAASCRSMSATRSAPVGQQLLQFVLHVECLRRLAAQAFCFSLQVMHTRVHGMASSRASAIGWPQSRHSRRCPLDALERFLDGLQDLGVGLFQLQLDVNLVVAAGLVRHVALAARVVLHRPLQGLARPPSSSLRLRSSASR